MTNIKLPEIRLISHTELPVETLLATWIQSRPTKFPEFFKWLNRKHGTDVATATLVRFGIENDILDEGLVADTFLDAVAADLPVSESIHFTWGFSSLPIEWREQAVRKRLWGFWVTSMREFDMRAFANEGRYCPPPETSVVPESLEYLDECMVIIQDMYNSLMDKYGWPQEKARKVVPLCATHNGTMFTDFRATRSTLQARSCWIAQIDTWEPWIRSVLFELRCVHQLLGMLVSPPCFKERSEEYLGCKYGLINKNRLSEKDDYAPCPLYCMNESHPDRTKTRYSAESCEIPLPSSTLWQGICEEYGTKPVFLKDAIRLIDVWRDIWGRDPFSGQLTA